MPSIGTQGWLNYNLQQFGVNIMNNLECQNLLVDHCIKLSLQSCQDSPSTDQIVRLPYMVYLYCNQVFKRKHQISCYLLQKITQIFYLQDLKLSKEKSADSLTNSYRQLLQGIKDSKAFYLAQINVRLLLLGLSVKLGKIQIQIFRCRFRDLVKNLQIELVTTSGESLSDVIINELQFMNTQFHSLQYYQELKFIFDKLDIFKVVRWIQNAMEQQRKLFQEKTQSILAFRPQQGKTELKSNLKKTENNQPNSQIQKQAQQKQKTKVQKESINKSSNLMKTANKQKRSKSPNINQRKISCIRIANQMRRSNASSGVRFSSKYIFKSTKKQKNDLVYQYSQEPDTEQNFVQVRVNEKESAKTDQPTIQTNQHEQENSRVLCPATPPRTNKKYIPN